MEDERIYKEFQKFAVRSWCVEILIFFTAVRDFRVSTPDEKLPLTAQQIYQDFFSDSASMDVNIDEVLKNEVVEAIKENVINREMFVKCEKQVYSMLKFGPFRMWSKTKEFGNICRKYGVDIDLKF